MVVNGRQTGKTTAAIHEIVKLALATPNSLWYWIDPSHKFSLKCLEIFKREYPAQVMKKLGIKVKKAQDERSLTFTRNGAKIEFFTASNPDSLVGQTINGCVVNEAGLIENPDVWSRMLLPALGAKQGIGIFVSTPRSKNWFYDMFQAGKEGCKDWNDDFEKRDQSCNCGKGIKHQYHTFHNPTTPITSSLTADEIEMARNQPTMTEQKFRMEYLGTFLEDSSEVFRNFRSCIKGGLEPPAGHASYYIGVDLGKHRDFTVVMVLDRSNNHIVHFDRFNGLPWNVIEQRIIAIYHRYRGRVIIDGTGVGDAVCSNLRRHISNMEVFTFGGLGKKVGLIENLISLMEHEDVSFPFIPELITELSEFNFRITPSGNVKYEGREASHDDCVIALALACHPLRIKAVRQLNPKQAKLVKRQLRL